MFDLSESILNWRNRLESGGACGRGDIDELESHLRDEIDQLRLQGLSEEESFLVAQNRLGDTSVLNKEFSKINPWAIWRFRVFWMAIGVLTFSMYGVLTSIFSSSGAMVLGSFDAISPFFFGIGAIAAHIVAIGLLVLFFKFGLRRITPTLKRWFGGEGRKVGEQIVYAFLLVVIIQGFKLFPFVAHTVLSRNMGNQALGVYSLVNYWTASAFSFIFTILLVGVIVSLYPRYASSK